MSQNPWQTTTKGVPQGSARERIDRSAYELFSRRGARAVGIDEVVECSGVAKMTLYRHYASKDDLVIGFLRQREERWTRGWLQAGIERHGGSAAERLLAVFDLFDAWFRREDFEGCSFINVMLESAEPGHPVRQAAVAHLAEIRALLRGLAAEAGAEDPDALAWQWHILMNGCIVAACEGDVGAARRARDVARHLLPRGASRPAAKRNGVAVAPGLPGAGTAAPPPATNGAAASAE